MKNVHLLTLGFCLFGLMSCSEKDLYQGGDTDETEKTANTFDFSTVSKTNVSISYVNTGLPTQTYFEVYVEEPITWSEEGTAIKKEGMNPLYCGYTNDDGTFSSNIELPAYATKIYVYTPAFFATTLMTADITNGKATVSDAEAETRATSRSFGEFLDWLLEATEKKYTTRAITLSKWNTFLGDWNETTGVISYPFKNTASNLSITADDAKRLMSIHADVINVKKDCPIELRTSKDLKVSLSDKDKAEKKTGAEVAITLLGGNTCWSSSLGYYYYQEGQQPKSYDELVKNNRIIMIVPNTQDGEWSSNKSGAKECQGISRGTTVQLYYYGENVKKEDESNEFPDGTRIGFVLFSHAWQHNATNCGAGGNANHTVISSTTPYCNIIAGDKAYTQGSGCAMYTTDGEHILMSFEDHNNDQNFSDVVFTMNTNPVGAFTDVHVTNGSETETTMANGIYCFEDMWPKEGDYDMNDVMVNSSTSRTITTKTTTTTTGTSSSTAYERYCTAESFKFSIYQNRADLTNGLAFTLEAGSEDASVQSNATFKMTVNGVEKELKRSDDGKVFYITDNVKDMINVPIEITASYDFDSKVHPNIKTKVHPFIYRKQDNGKYWEVHIPFEAPTQYMDKTLFGNGVDASDVDNNKYYVRKGDYPFAFFLSNANNKNVAKLLDSKNESTPIDQLYSGWSAWATNQNSSEAKWYKEEE